MKKQTINASDNRIVYLDNDEITDPIKVVHDFFSHSWLPNHLKIFPLRNLANHKSANVDITMQ